eukprot:3060321-Pleurochrysis_carterae.AAC.1
MLLSRRLLRRPGGVHPRLHRARVRAVCCRNALEPHGAAAQVESEAFRHHLLILRAGRVVFPLRKGTVDSRDSFGSKRDSSQKHASSFPLSADCQGFRTIPHSDAEGQQHSKDFGHLRLATIDRAFDCEIWRSSNLQMWKLVKFQSADLEVLIVKIRHWSAKLKKQAFCSGVITIIIYWRWEICRIILSMW